MRFRDFRDKLFRFALMTKLQMQADEAEDENRSGIPLVDLVCLFDACMQLVPLEARPEPFNHLGAARDRDRPRSKQNEDYTSLVVPLLRDVRALCRLSHSLEDNVHTEESVHGWWVSQP